MSTKKTQRISFRPRSLTTTIESPNHERSPIVIFLSQPAPLIFLNWIDPPIGVNMTGVDNVNQFYKVSLMSVGTVGGGSTLILPFAEPFQWNPMVLPTVQCQYQITSILPKDPTTPSFYDTMTLTQLTGGQQTIRTRLFTPPPAAALATEPVAVATAGPPTYFRVSGIVDSTNNPRTILYLHFTTNDQYGPTDLFIQQPW